MNDILFSQNKIVLTVSVANMLRDKVNSALNSLKECPNSSSVSTFMFIPKEDKDSIKIEIIINKE